MTSHPLDMTLSVTGWNVDPTLLDDLSLELVHSEQFGGCFRIKMAFKNGTDALIEIDVKEGDEMDVYDALTGAIRTRRVLERPVLDDGD
jgi:hypothetical protein